MRRWLESQNLQVDGALDDEILEVLIPDTDDRRLRILFIDEGEFIVFSMVTNATVPRARWAALYPLLSQANGELACGAWVLDPDTERIAFRAAIPGRGAIYEPECLKQVMAYVARTVGTMEGQFRGASGDDVLAAWMSEPTDS